jgi:hypothetical protein
MAGDIFEEDPVEFVPEFTGDTGDVWPEVPLVGFSAALSGRAKWLAGVSGEKGVDCSGERTGVECGEVVPDRRGGEVSGPLCGDDDRSRVCVPFDICPGVEVGFGETEAHIQSSAACAEG